MKSNLHILFFLYRSKVNEKQQMPIFCRITIDGKRKQFSTGCFISATNWLSKAGRHQGSSVAAKHINSRIRSIRTKLLKAYQIAASVNTTISSDLLYDYFTGKVKTYQMLLEVFDKHNTQMHALVGKDYSPATYGKYVLIRNHVQEFIQHTYRLADYPLKGLGPGFLQNLDFYLKTTKSQNQNTINKTIERVKKVVKLAVGNGWLAADPFLLFKGKAFAKDIVFLNSNELHRLETCLFPPRLAAVRDFFLFSCYTGLAYREASVLAREHLKLDDNGLLWIEMVRQKTKRPVLVPVLPNAVELLNRYEWTHKDGPLLPQISNQKLNSYLKEIAIELDIDKCLTHHVARKTFASTVLLNNDVPLEITSFLLGHSHTATTKQFYAKIIKDAVLPHFERISKYY